MTLISSCDSGIASWSMRAICPFKWPQSKAPLRLNVVETYGRYSNAIITNDLVNFSRKMHREAFMADTLCTTDRTRPICVSVQEASEQEVVLNLNFVWIHDDASCFWRLSFTPGRVDP